MAIFSATFDTSALDRQLRELRKMDQWAAFGRALSRAGQSMRKQGIAETQSVLNLKSGSIRDVMKIRRSQRRSLSAELVISGKAHLLSSFTGTRDVRPGGLSVKVKREGARKRIGYGFLAPVVGGRKIPLARRLQGGRRVGRYPTEALYGPSTASVLHPDDIRKRRILNAGIERFKRELRREITRRLAGARAAA